ncbi:Bifunctional uridylyltransferase/uridylyl-removing enzyme [Arsenophonus endosymbiont of Bemisia tabaci Q2]|nr:Bifunctional uridylyltransferase/uridylyl-removing enzyme [Arsenophonus endosymbiont of Bemisia tabaci Q2]
MDFQVGHSVRTLEKCLQAGQTDLSISTNVFELRLICGDQALFLSLQQAIYSDNFWPSDKFFLPNVVNNSCATNVIIVPVTTLSQISLEPDIKSSPGGLSDIDILLWVARRHFGATTIEQTVHFDFLSQAEYRELKICLNFLLRIRFALHLMIKCYDNRLVFEHQLNVARLLGYQGKDNQPVEKMMKDYYRVIRPMLLQLFDEAILSENKPSRTHINLIYLGDFKMITSNYSISVNLYWRKTYIL